MIAGRYYVLHTIQLFIRPKQPNNAFCIGYHIIMIRIWLSPKIKEVQHQHLVQPEYHKAEDSEVAGWTWARYVWTEWLGLQRESVKQVAA